VVTAPVIAAPPGPARITDSGSAAVPRTTRTELCASGARSRSGGPAPGDHPATGRHAADPAATGQRLVCKLSETAADSIGIENIGKS
jgi:hypothetical protein